MQITPTQLITSHLFDFDHANRSTLMRILQPSTQPLAPQCSASRMDRAMDKLALPTRHQGGGIAKATLVGPIAFHASVAICHTLDRDLADVIGQGFERFNLPQHALVCEALGPPSPLSRNTETMFPRDAPAAWTDNTFYVGLYNTHLSLKLQKVLTSTAHANAARDLINRNDSRLPTVTRSDEIAALTNSQAASLLTVPLSVKHNRIPDLVFIAAIRCWLGIPQIPHLGNLAQDPEYDYLTETCQAPSAKHPESTIDLHGNHANSQCPATSRGRHNRHSYFKYVVYYLAEIAGAKADMEPKTSALLLDQFTEGDCKKLFMKAPNAEQQALVNQALAIMQAGPTTEAKQTAAALLESLVPRESDTKGLRIDVALSRPHDQSAGSVLWVDVTSVSSTCQTRIDAELKDICEKKVFMSKSEQASKPLADIDWGGHALKQQEQHKRNVYAPLMAVAAKQLLDNRREVAPIFLAPAISTLGEFSEDCIKLQEWLLTTYKMKLAREGPRDDGQSANQLTAAFRQQIRQGLIVAVAKGQGQMLLAAGLPAQCCKRNLTSLSPHAKTFVSKVTS